MFDPALFVAFLAAAAILTLTPGVDTAMVLQTAAADGSRSAMFAAIGIMMGCLGWGAAVALGLGALLQVSEMAYTIVKWIGAAYLIWLGSQLLLQPRRGLAAADDGARPTGLAALRRGFLTNILNPKVGVFYVTFFPQFIPQGANVGSYTFLLACTHIVLILIWFALLIAATAPLGRLLRKPRVITTMDRLTGLVFIGFGLKLAVSRG